MAAKNKARGNRLEYKIVKLAEKYGLKAKRAWGSDGRSMGLVEQVDVLLEGKIKLQCKMRKKFPQWMNVEEGVDYQVVQTDNKPPMIIMPIEEYLEMFLLAKGLRRFKHE